MSAPKTTYDRCTDFCEGVMTNPLLQTIGSSFKSAAISTAQTTVHVAKTGYGYFKPQFREVPLDPFTTLFRLAVFPHYQKGTKLGFDDHRIYYHKPGKGDEHYITKHGQGIRRFLSQDSRILIPNLEEPINLAIRLSQVQTPDKRLFKLFTYAAGGLKCLQEVYSVESEGSEKDRTTICALQSYIDRLEACKIPETSLMQKIQRIFTKALGKAQLVLEHQEERAPKAITELLTKIRGLMRACFPLEQAGAQAGAGQAASDSGFVDLPLSPKSGGSKQDDEVNYSKVWGDKNSLKIPLLHLNELNNVDSSEMVKKGSRKAISKFLDVRDQMFQGEFKRAKFCESDEIESADAADFSAAAAEAMDAMVEDKRKVLSAAAAQVDPVGADSAGAVNVKDSA
jgi:hypothetical protein